MLHLGLDQLQMKVTLLVGLMSLPLSWQLALESVEFNFPEFQDLRNTYAKYTLCCAFVTITQWLG
jgi:hypothetical protein